jgi:soluble lytic murein transglycosylase-like protein
MALLGTLTAIMASFCDAGAVYGSEPTNICEREMIRAANQSAVPLGVLYAVALTETGQRGSLHAYAMNIEGRAAFNPTLHEAMTQFAVAKRAGAVLIDVGCMQINHHFHGAKFNSLEDMFDPSQNVDYAARFLKNLRQSEGSWTAAVARYHAGPNNQPAQKSYVCAVIANMIASGFGSWTQSSKAFCHP